MPAEQTADVLGFKGLNERKLLGVSPSETSNLDNVRVRYGEVKGRLGIAKYRSITTAAGSTPIIALMPYPRGDNTTDLLRMLPTKVERLNTSTDVWDDKTGTDLTGTSTTLPQFTIMDDLLLFTNEGNDLPRKVDDTGDSTVLAGSPPFCKAIASAWGFLFALNVSTDGTFTDVNLGHLRADYTDNPDDWSACEQQFLFYDETPGPIVTAKTFGIDFIVFKSD